MPRPSAFAAATVACLWLSICSGPALAMKPFSGPVFTHEPNDVLIVDNLTTLSIECHATGDPPPSYQWYVRYNGDYSHKFLTDTKGLTVRGGVVRMQIYSLVPEDNSVNIYDGAVFQCEASNLHGSVLSREATMTFGDLSDFNNTRSVRSESVSVGDRATMHCPRVSWLGPDVQYAWYKDNDTSNVVSQKTDPRVFSSVGGSLFIEHVSTQDAGTYHCTVTLSDVGSGAKMVGVAPFWIDEIGIKLNVSPGGTGYNSTSAPDIVRAIPQYPEHPYCGDTVTMQCYASDSHYNTAFQYMWSPLPDKYILSDGNRTLTLPNVRMEDAGTYRCRAVGEYGDDEEANVLKVRTKPFFIQKMSNRLVEDGDQLELECFPSNDSLTAVQWYKDGKPMIGAESTTFVVPYADTDLDSGMYQCKAINEWGSAFDSAQVSFRGVYFGHWSAASGRKQVSVGAISVAIVTMMLTVSIF